MSFKYTYDEHGVTFYYFLLTVLGIYLVPMTWSLIKRKAKVSKAWHCHCNLCHEKSQRIREKAKANKGWTMFKYLCEMISRSLSCIVGWMLVAVLLKQLKEAPVQALSYDPYAILGLESGATETEVRKTYKQLSMKMHPDRVPEERKKEAETIFVELSKAYQALTDPIVRENWEKYGNPDGIRSFSLGIALPAWLVDNQNSWYVLGAYGLVFGIALPIFVGKWWSKSKKYTKDKILHLSMGLYYREMKDNMTIRKLVEVLSASMEFKEEVEWRESDNATVPEFFQKMKKEIESITGDTFERSKKFTAPYCFKAYLALYAHMFRIAVDDKQLEADFRFIIDKSVHLLLGMLKISIARDWLNTSLNCMTLCQMLVQGVWENQSCLLQLPHFNNEIIKHCKSKKKPIKSFKDLLDLNEDDRKALLKTLDESQIKDILNVAKSFPIVSIDSVSLKVLGQNNVTTDGLVTCQVKLSVTRAGAPVISISPAEAEENTLEIDEDGNIEQVSAAKKALMGIENPNEPIHAPRISPEKRPYWWVLVASTKSNTLLAPPVKVADLVDFKTVVLLFKAPSKPGEVTLTVHVKCDSIFGTDISKDVKMNVMQDTAEDEQAVDEELSDEEKDAGGFDD